MQCGLVARSDAVSPVPAESSTGLATLRSERSFPLWAGRGAWPDVGERNKSCEGDVAVFKNLVLEKPLAIIDLETTGTDTQNDRIVEIGILKVAPDGGRLGRLFRINPGIPIPPAATNVHGITDQDVAEESCFADVATELLALLDGCDLCGFNLKRFDLRLLHAEFGRVRLQLQLTGRAILDVLEIFHTYEKRDLAAAVRFYCGRGHDNAHSAGADVEATAEVLDAMLARYEDLPRSAAELHQHFHDPNAVDSSGSFVRTAGQVHFAFGKHRGQPLDAVARAKPDYLKWMLAQDFFDDTKAVVRQALAAS
jgi:DNA polymerase III subunit epsilon